MEAELRAAAIVLNEGKKVAILISAGAAHSAAEVQEIANILGAGVAKALIGKTAIPDDLPYVTGSIGMLLWAMVPCRCWYERMITISKYWQEWSDPRLLVIVLNDRDLNMVTWEQRLQVGDLKYNASQDIPDVPYGSFAELLGLKVSA